MSRSTEQQSARVAAERTLSPSESARPTRAQDSLRFLYRHQCTVDVCRRPRASGYKQEPSTCQKRQKGFPRELSSLDSVPPAGNSPVLGTLRAASTLRLAPLAPPPPPLPRRPFRDLDRCSRGNLCVSRVRQKCKVGALILPFRELSVLARYKLFPTTFGGIFECFARVNKCALSVLFAIFTCGKSLKKLNFL